MPTYDFTRWSGGHERVSAAEVTFPAGALVFRDGDRLVLAVKPGDWNDLREVESPAHRLFGSDHAPEGEHQDACQWPRLKCIGHSEAVAHQHVWQGGMCIAKGCPDFCQCVAGGMGGHQRVVPRCPALVASAPNLGGVQ